MILKDGEKLQQLVDDLKAAREKFEARCGASLEAHVQGTRVMPGGNTRSVLYNKPFPVSMLRGAGARLYDVDGHEYVDFVAEMSAGIYGHSHPVILEAVAHVARNLGLSLGASTVYEQHLLGHLCARFPSVEKVRFCNSGTELNVQCILAAQYFTGRRKIVVFEGAYHGGPLTFSKGNHIYNLGHHDFLTCAYNDVGGLLELFRENGAEIAGVLVEGMLGAGGCLLADEPFLQLIQTTCRANNSLFILDEVMTSRLGFGGLQKKLGLSPDLTSLGKYIGGGLTCGAFGGRDEVMAVFDPSSDKYLPHSGTFNNNTMTMYVGHVALTQVYDEEAATKLNAAGQALLERIRAKLWATSRMQVTGCGSSFNIHFFSDAALEVDVKRVVEKSDPVLKELFWLDMLELGYWTSSRGMVNLSVALSELDIDSFAELVEAWIDKRRGYL